MAINVCENCGSAFRERGEACPDCGAPLPEGGEIRRLPHAIFASPQVASVGLTERAAREQGLPYVASSYAYYDTAYGSSIEDKDGFVKALAHKETGEILGCHIIGSEASMLIQEVVNVMRMRLATDAITQSIYVHPALPEVVQRAFGSLPA